MQVFSLFDDKKYFERTVQLDSPVLSKKDSVPFLSLKQLFLLCDNLTSWGLSDFSLHTSKIFVTLCFQMGFSSFFFSNIMRTLMHQTRWVHLMNKLAFSSRVAEAVQRIFLSQGIPKVTALCSPSLTKIFTLSPLSCMFTICSRKPTGKWYHCHSKKSRGIKLKKKKKEVEGISAISDLWSVIVLLENNPSAW